MSKTCIAFNEAVDQSNAKEILSNAFNIPLNELKLMGAALYVEDPNTVKQSQLHTAVGFVIKLNNDTNVKPNTNELLSKIQIDGARIRIWPKCNWMVAFYPYVSCIGSLSYMIGAY
eukprot:198695_1